MKYREVDETDLLLNVDPALMTTPDAEAHYVVSVPHADGSLARIHFDRHLYQPLLIQGSNPDIRVSPPPLNESETRVVRDLRNSWKERGSELYPESELFLLRNQGRGRGVGCSLEGTGFYADFILWMISGDRQRVVFVEPQGMIHVKTYEEDEKAKLHERLPTLAKQTARRSGVAGEVSLDPFVVSATEYDELRRRYGDGSWTKEDFAMRHILFADRECTYLETLLADG